MGVRKRHNQWAAELSPLWLHLFAAEANAAVAGDELEVPEHHGCAEGTHWGPCPMHHWQTTEDSSVPFLAVARRVMLRNYHASFMFWQKSFHSVSASTSRFPVGKNSAVMSPEQCHPAVPVLLDKRNSLRFFSVRGSGVSCWPQPGIFLCSRMRSQHHKTLQHSHSTKEQPHLWSINQHKTCPQEKQEKCYWLPPFLLVFVLVSTKWVEDGTREVGEQRSSFAPPVVGRGVQNSRVGIRCGNSAKQIK